MSLSYWSHGGEGVSWRTWAPFHPSAALGGGRSTSRNSLWGRNTGGDVGGTFSLLCGRPAVAPVSGFGLSGALVLTGGGWLLLVTSVPGGSQGMWGGKGLRFGPHSAVSLTHSWCHFSQVPFRHPRDLFRTKSGRSALPRLGRSDPGKCWIPSLEVRAQGQQKTAGLSMPGKPPGVLLSWSHLSKALSQSPICNMKRNNIYLAGLSLGLEKICVEWLEFTQYLFNL